MTPKEFARELEACVHRMDEQFQQSRTFAEARIEEARWALAERTKGQKPDAALGRLWHHLKITLPNPLRYTLLSGACSILEYALKEAAIYLIPDVAERKKELRKSENAIRANEKYQNWLKSYIHLISPHVGLSPTKAFLGDVTQFNDVVSLRNCIMHSWGDVDSDDFKEDLREAVKRIAEIAERQNCDFVSISTDGYLILGDKMVPHAQCLAVNIADFICRAMKN